MNQNEWQVGLIKNDGNNSSHQVIFEKLVRERFNKIIELTHEAISII